MAPLQKIDSIILHVLRLNDYLLDSFVNYILNYGATSRTIKFQQIHKINMKKSSAVSTAHEVM